MVIDRASPSLFAGDGPRNSLLVTLLDVAPSEFDGVVSVVNRKFSGMRYRVYLTCDPDLGYFHRAGHPVEYLPSTAEQHRRAEGRDWPLYLRERVALMTAKWLPARILSYGTSLEAFIAKAPAPPPVLA